MIAVKDLLGRFPKAIVIAVVAALLLVVGLLATMGGSEERTVTAHFDRAVSVFPESQVRILGVPVGRVTAVVPEGETVRVDMTYDAAYDVPADAKAVIITPTLTADRFVQLTPAYTGGDKLEDGATIEVEDTAVPVELDRIYRSLSDLTKALGPNGVNRDGTLNSVLTQSAKFLDGRGEQANETIVAMSKAAKTFGDNSGELFATVRALDEFTGALAANDTAMARFMDDLGAVSQQLAGEKEELSAALANLAGVLGKVERFVRDNRQMLNADLADLARIMKVIAGERRTLETVLDIGPSALGNLVVAFDPDSGTIGSRLRFEGNTADIDGLLCTQVHNYQLPNAAEACELFETLLEPIFANPSSPPSGPPSGLPGVPQVRYGNALPAKDLTGLLGGAA